MGDAWIKSVIDRSQKLPIEQIEQSVITALIEAVYRNTQSDPDRRLAFAAAFDLLATVEYFRNIDHIGWLYCPEENQPLLIYPYTNACPRCALKNKFVFHQANKPKSGVIGRQTSRLLAAFLQGLFTKNKLPVEVRKGVEPVDLVLLDTTIKPTAVMFAEIKAAPLLTLPLALPYQTLGDNEASIQSVTHQVIDHLPFEGATLSLLLPQANQDSRNWELISFGRKATVEDGFWAYYSLLNLLNTNKSFMADYFSLWQTAFRSYQQKSQSGVFWLTNACGQPAPRPENWPRRSKASGFESISDSKTSVGMDRTDDLKKATYQALKIGAEGNPATQYDYRVGIISNIHAVRHYEDYLTAIQDIVWTRDERGFTRQVSGLPPEAPIFNLFDGIIALTEAKTRDGWVHELFDF